MIRARSEWIVRKRDGRLVPFESSMIERAVANAFRAELNLAENQPLDDSVAGEVAEMSEEVAAEISAAAATPDGADVEKIQDFVELMLMKRGHYRVARKYIVYRAEHAKIRSLRATEPLHGLEEEIPSLQIKMEDGLRVPCLLYTSPSPRDLSTSRMPSSA